FALGFDKGVVKAVRSAVRTEKKVLRANLKTANSLRTSKPDVARALAGEVISRREEENKARAEKGDKDEQTVAADPGVTADMLAQALKIRAIAHSEGLLYHLEWGLDRSESQVYSDGFTTISELLQRRTMDRGQRARFKSLAANTVLRYNNIVVKR